MRIRRADGSLDLYLKVAHNPTSNRADANRSAACASAAREGSAGWRWQPWILMRARDVEPNGMR